MDEQKMPRRPRRAAEDTPKNESLVYGKNPVTELLKSGSGVDTVLLAEGMAPAVAAYFTAMAKEAGATVKRVHPNKLRLMTGTESHQGVAAFASEIEYASVEDLLAAAIRSSTVTYSISLAKAATPWWLSVPVIRRSLLGCTRLTVAPASLAMAV